LIIFELIFFNARSSKPRILGASDIAKRYMKCHAKTARPARIFQGTSYNARNKVNLSLINKKINMGFLDKIFGKKQIIKEISEEKLDQFFGHKEEAMKSILGEMYGLVGHAIIPFQIGGAVDMYYFPNTIEGTTFTTMELIEYENKGPIPNRNGMYELLAFTRHKINKQVGAMAEQKNDDPFEKIERRICGIFTSIGNFSYQAKLEPGETCEIPCGEGQENTCLLFDEYKKEGQEFKINGKKYGLLVCIEVFRSEMEYAMEKGSQALFKILKEKGYYPYSDLDREPVI